MNSFSAVIIRWFREYGRDLPWRETKDPYAIWLSEIILQQTRIAQGGLAGDAGGYEPAPGAGYPAGTAVFGTGYRYYRDAERGGEVLPHAQVYTYIIFVGRFQFQLVYR